MYSDQVRVDLQIIRLSRLTRHCHGWSEDPGVNQSIQSGNRA
jgi:hypothetical protein